MFLDFCDSRCGGMEWKHACQQAYLDGFVGEDRRSSSIIVVDSTAQSGIVTTGWYL